MEETYEQILATRPSLFTVKEYQDILRKNGTESFSLQNDQISWNKRDIKSMIGAQLKINDTILTKKLNSQDISFLKQILRTLTNDIREFYTSTCSVCKDKQSTFSHMNVEHIKMKESWGYESLYDCETHELTMCCNCYDIHIINGALGKFVKRKDYM